VPGPVASAFIADERAILESGGVDFDDLVIRALGRLEGDATLLAQWRAQTTSLLVDEAQDPGPHSADLALLLAAPGNNVFFVGDDDQALSKSCSSTGPVHRHPTLRQPSRLARDVKNDRSSFPVRR